MSVILIASVAKNRAIGNFWSIPWNIPEWDDYVAELTEEQPVLVGRKTYFARESIFDILGAQRIPLVLTGNRDLKSKIIKEHGVPCFSIDDALERCKKYEKNLYVLGGEEVYAHTINLANRLEIAHVDREDSEDEVDAFFPAIDKRRWVPCNKRRISSDISFVTYRGI